MAWPSAFSDRGSLQIRRLAFFSPLEKCRGISNLSIRFLTTGCTCYTEPCSVELTLFPQLLSIVAGFLAEWIHKVALVVALKEFPAGVAAHLTLAALLRKSIVDTVAVDVGRYPSNCRHKT